MTLSIRPPSAPYTINLRINRPYVPPGRQSIVFAALQIDATGVVGPAVPRSPTAMAIVIDRSGSMADENKMSYAIQGALQAINSLDSTDYVTVVVFDDVAELLVPLTPLTNRASVESRVRSITPGGTTNMYDAIVMARDQLARSPVGYVRRIVVLTDGQVNEGVTDTPSFVRLATDIRGGLGASITSIGLGADYNEDLLREISMASGGQWYHVTRPDQLADIFMAEAMQAKTVISVKPELRLELFGGAELLECYKVKPMLNQISMKAAGGAYTIPLSDIMAGQDQIVVFRLRIPPLQEGSWNIGNVTITSQGREIAKASLVLTAVNDPSLTEREYDPYPRVLLASAQATVLARKAVEEGRMEELEKAETIIRSLGQDAASRETIIRDETLKELVDSVTVVRQATLTKGGKLSPEDIKDLKYKTTVVGKGKKGSS